jgi:hypothetical protein
VRFDRVPTQRQLEAKQRELNGGQPQ